MTDHTVGDVSSGLDNDQRGLPTFAHYAFELHTKGEFDVVDVTRTIEGLVAESNVRDGVAVVFSRHTTCGVIVNERETGLLSDLRAALDRLIPASAYYRHDDLSVRTENLAADEPENGFAHIRHILAGRASETVPITSSVLRLGPWQRIMIVEFDRGRRRHVDVCIYGLASSLPAGASLLESADLGSRLSKR